MKKYNKYNNEGDRSHYHPKYQRDEGGDRKQDGRRGGYSKYNDRHNERYGRGGGKYGRQGWGGREGGFRVGQLVQIPDKQLSCPICSNTLKSPKVLPCLHTSCKTCLEQLLKSEKLQCPICNQDTLLPANKMETLPNHPWVDIALESQQMKDPSSPCMNCYTSNIHLLCKDCALYLCKNCESSHKTHTLMELSQFESSSVLLLYRPRMCGNHKYEEIKIYCEDCKRALCRLCATDNHRNHNKSNSLSQVAEREKKDIQVLVNEIKRHVPILEASIGGVKDMIGCLEARSLAIEGVIHSQLGGDDVRKGVLCGELEVIKKSKMDTLIAQKQSLELMLSNLTTSIQFAESGLSNCHDLGLLDIVSLILTRLNQFKSIQSEQIPQDNDAIGTHLDNSDSIGSIYDSSASLDHSKLIGQKENLHKESLNLTIELIDTRGTLCNAKDIVQVFIHENTTKEQSFPEITQSQNILQVHYDFKTDGNYHILIHINGKLWKEVNLNFWRAFPHEDLLCIHCGKTFQLATQASPCKYHPGTLTSSTKSSQGMCWEVTYFTCCYLEVEYPFPGHETGCTLNQAHQY